MAELAKLGDKIRSIRGALTQQEFAKILDISQGSVAKYENGLAMPRASILFRIAELGQISVETLLKKANLTRSFPKSANPQSSGANPSVGSTDNLSNLIVSLNKISDLDHELGELVADLVKAFSQIAENPDLRMKGRKAIKNALKTLGFPS